MKGQEIEVKFYVIHLSQIEQRLQNLGALLIQPRTFETNLRFDLPDSSLRQTGKALRLRQDEHARITFKGTPQQVENVISRAEFETTLGDFETGRNILEGLGYVLVATYEKYRTTYDLGEFHIMLDELPYGNFVEIEGPDVETLKSASAKLGLNFNAAIPASYLAIFERLCHERSLDPATQLTFSALDGMQFNGDDLSAQAADENADAN